MSKAAKFDISDDENMDIDTTKNNKKRRNNNNNDSDSDDNNNKSIKNSSKKSNKTNLSDSDEEDNNKTKKQEKQEKHKKKSNNNMSDDSDEEDNNRNKNRKQKNDDESNNNNKKHKKDDDSNNKKKQEKHNNNDSDSDDNERIELARIRAAKKAAAAAAAAAAEKVSKKQSNKDDENMEDEKPTKKSNKDEAEGEQQLKERIANGIDRDKNNNDMEDEKPPIKKSNKDKEEEEEEESYKKNKNSNNRNEDSEEPKKKKNVDNNTSSDNNDNNNKKKQNKEDEQTTKKSNKEENGKPTITVTQFKDRNKYFAEKNDPYLWSNLYTYNEEKNYNIQYLEDVNKDGFNANKPTLIISKIGDSRGKVKKNLRMLLAVAYTNQATPFPMGSHLDVARKEAWEKYDTSGKVYNKLPDAVFTKMISNIGHPYGGLNMTSMVPIKPDKNGPVQYISMELNVAFTKSLVKIRRLERDIIEFLVNNKPACATHSASKIKDAVEEATKQVLREEKIERKVYNEMQRGDRLPINKKIADRICNMKTAFVSQVIPMEEHLRTELDFSDDFDELIKNQYFINKRRHVMRFKNDDEEMDPLIESCDELIEYFKGDNVDCEVQVTKDLNDGLGARKITEKKGRSYNPPTIMNTSKGYYCPLGYVDEKQVYHPFQFIPGDITADTVIVKFQPYGDEFHLSLEWESTIITSRGVHSKSDPKAAIMHNIADWDEDDILIEASANYELNDTNKKLLNESLTASRLRLTDGNQNNGNDTEIKSLKNNKK